MKAKGAARFLWNMGIANIFMLMKTCEYRAVFKKNP